MVFDQEGENPLSSTLKGALGLAPLAYLISQNTGFKNMVANQATTATGIFPSGNVGSVSRSVGVKLAKGLKTKVDQAGRADKIAEELLSSDNALTQLFSKVGEYEALVQSLIDSVDEFGYDSATMMARKQELLDIANRASTSPEQAKEVLKSAIKAIVDSGSADTKRRWVGNLREYKKVGAQLVPPTMDLFPGNRYNQVDPSSLTGSAKARYDRLMDGLGKGHKNVDVVEMQESGIKQIYARLYSSGNSKNKRFLASIPLNLGHDPINGRAFARVYSNENLTTAYRTDRALMDASKAQELLGRKASSSAILSQAVIPLEDHFLDEVLRRVKPTENGYWMADKNALGEWQRQYLAADARIATTGNAYKDASGFVSHLQAVSQYQHNFATLVNFGNMTRASKEQLVTGLATLDVFDAGVSAGRIFGTDLDRAQMATIGFRSQSAISSLRSIVRGNDGPDRFYFPVESRIEQVTGREGMFVQAKARRMGRGGVFAAGATSIKTAAGYAQVSENIEWASSLTGGTNKAILFAIDEDNEVYKALEGKGLSYHRGVERILEPLNIPLLDPKVHKNMSTRLLERVLAQKPGERLNLTKAEIDELGGFAGIGPSRQQFLKGDPRLIGASLGVDVFETGGKRQINLVGHVERSMETFKGFSTMSKGILREITEESEARMIGGLLPMLEELGITANDRIIAAPDMLKKGPGFLDLQMRSAYGLISGDTDFDQTLMSLARTQQYGRLGDSELGRATGSVIKALSERHVLEGIAPDQIGAALAAVYRRGTVEASKMDAARKKDPGTAFQKLSREAFEETILEAFGGSGAEVLQKIKDAKFALAAATFTKGTGVGDAGRGRTRVEPRVLTNLQHRLTSLGLNREQVGDVLTSIYEKKVGLEPSSKITEDMLRLTETLVGVAGPEEAIAEMRGLPRIGLKELSNSLIGKETSAILDEHTGGFMLDLTKDLDTPAQREIAGIAAEKLGQGQIFIPGKDTLGNARDTYIKAQGGQQLIEDEYTRMITNFLDNVNLAQTDPANAGQMAKKSIDSFKESAIGLTSHLVAEMAGGKIRGMSASVADMYDLNYFTDLGPVKGQLALDVFKKSRGTAVFKDTKAFLTQLNDWMGNSGENAEEAARAAERFFLSLESGTAHTARGNTGVTIRAPALSIGNVPLSQSFRHVAEIQQGINDEGLNLFLNSPKGERYSNHLKKKGIDVRSWQDVASMPKHRRRQFFKQFVKNLGDFANEGGGRTFFPVYMGNVEYSDSSGSKTIAKVDFGLWSAAGGDYDGDPVANMPFNDGAGKHVMSSLMSPSARTDYFDRELAYKVKSEIFANEAKKGLETHLRKMGVDTSDLEDLYRNVDKVKQGLLKEAASKAYVGPLDVKLNMLRTSLLDSNLPGAQVDEALALLKVVQEHSVIKGKKLPVYRPFAEMLGAAIDTAITGDFSAFNRVLKEEIFPGSALVSGGVNINGSLADAPEFLQNSMRAMQGFNLKLDDTLAIIQQAVYQTKDSESHLDGSANRLALALGGGQASAEKALRRTRAGLNASSGIHAGMQGTTVKGVTAQAGQVAERVMHAATTANKKYLGMIAGGLGATALLGLAVSDNYSADSSATMSPIMSQRIQDKNLFAPRDVAVSLEAMNTGQAPEITGRIINPGTTYVKKRNGFTIRGSLDSTSGVGSLQSTIMNSGNASGSIRINDNRRPITQNYIDRLTGE